MPGFERAATIDRPPRQVYAALDDIHGARQWMPAIRKVEVLTPGFAVDVGYRWRETRAVWGIFRMSAELEVVAHDAPRTWGVKFEDRRLRMTATFELAPSGTGTLITLREDVEDLQGKPKRAERTAAWMEKADGDLLLRLKAHVESQPIKADLVEQAAPAAPAPEAAAPAAGRPRKTGPRAKRASKGTAKAPRKTAGKRKAKKAATSRKAASADPVSPRP